MLTRTLTTLACASLLSLATAQAATWPPPPPPGLTQGEQRCFALGAFVENRALERDADWTQLQVLSRSRQFDQQHRVDADIRATHDWAIGLVYQYPTLTPTVHRQLAESGCVQRLTTPAPTTTLPSANPGRY